MESDQRVTRTRLTAKPTGPWKTADKSLTIAAHLVVLAALALPAAGEPMGPPAPQSRWPEPQRVYTEAERDRAHATWKLWAAGWALDAATTVAVLERGGDEAPVGLAQHAFRPIKNRWWRAAAVHAARAGLAYYGWRRGLRRPETALRAALIWLAVSAAAGAWNVSIAW